MNCCRYFWMRISSMWHSKKKLGSTAENDTVMKEILDLLTYDSSEGGSWAIVSRGNNEMIMAHGNKLLPTLLAYDTWGHEVDHPDKFVHVLGLSLQNFKPDHHCNRLILPGAAGNIPDKVVCAECGKSMEMFVLYRCCDDE